MVKVLHKEHSDGTETYTIQGLSVDFFFDSDKCLDDVGVDVKKATLNESKAVEELMRKIADSRRRCKII